MEEIVTTALIFAAISAITPGPLMALIIGETLKHGRLNGIAIALAPLVTDLPIMIASVFVLSKLSNLDFVLGFISFFGAAYLTYLAYENITIRTVHLETATRSKSIMKGIITNFLNPNPYIFYFTILAPVAVRGMKDNFWAGPISVGVFLGAFVLLNILVALSISSAKRFIHSKRYLYLLRGLGLVLLFFAISFFRESLRFFGLFQ